MPRQEKIPFQFTGEGPKKTPENREKIPMEQVVHEIIVELLFNRDIMHDHMRFINADFNIKEPNHEKNFGATIQHYIDEAYDNPGIEETWPNKEKVSQALMMELMKESRESKTVWEKYHNAFEKIKKENEERTKEKTRKRKRPTKKHKLPKGIDVKRLQAGDISWRDLEENN